MTKPDSIQPLAMYQRSINWTLFGEPGCGKTPLISTGAKTLILDADHQTESAILAGSTAEVWAMDSWSDMEEAKEYCVHEKNFPFKWVWLDSGTQWQDLGLRDILADVVAAKPHRDPDVPDKPEYLRNQNRLMKWVAEMKAAPFNFGITAYPMQIEDANGKPLVMPMFVGKPDFGLTKIICGHMNLVTHLSIVKAKDDDERWQRLLTKRKDNIYSRDRFDALPTLMKNPTVPKVEARITAKLEEMAELVDKKRRSSRKKTAKRRRKPR